MLKNNKQLLVYPPMMALAFYSTLLGFMVPQLRDKFGLSLTQIGSFSTLQGVGMALSLVLCFCIFSAFNSIKISSLSMILFSLMMILFGLNTNIAAFYVLFFLIGLTQNTIDALSNTVIRETSRRKISLWLGLIHSLWALAGAAGPFLAIAVGGGYTQAFVWLGVFMAAATLLFVAGLWQQMKLPMLQNKHNFGGMLKLFRMFKIKGMPSLVILNVFNCFVQNTYIIFIADYMKSEYSFWLGGAITLSALFIGLLTGRTLFSLLADKIPVMRIMAISNGVAMLCFAGVFLTNSVAITAVLIGLGSTFTAMNFPALVLESHKLVPNDTASASSLIYIGLVIAILFAPPLIGFIGDAIGLRLALLITAAGLVPVVAVAGASAKRFDSQKA